METRYIRDLKKQITKLKKENAQLRKQTMRLTDEISDKDEDLHLINYAEESKEDKYYNSRRDPAGSCSHCGSYDVVWFSVGIYDMCRCESCGGKDKRLTKVS